MKKVILSIVTMFLISISYGQNATITKEGNYVAITQKIDSTEAKNTGKIFTDSKGKSYPVYVSKNGKLFTIRTSKAGNIYNSYLKL